MNDDLVVLNSRRNPNANCQKVELNKSKRKERVSKKREERILYAVWVSFSSLVKFS